MRQERKSGWLQKLAVQAYQATPFDTGQGIESSVIANKFWDLNQARDEVRALVS